MALTDVPVELSSTPSIVDGGNATAITIDSSEDITLANDITITGNAGIGVAAHASDALNITTTNQHIRFNNGSELGILALTSDGDLDFWAHGADEKINFRTGTGSGTVAMNVVGTNVGIGVSDPDQALIVKGVIETQASNSTNGWMMYTHTDNTFRINYNGAGADELVLNSSGLVGIGGTSASYKLHVFGDESMIRMQNTGSGTNGFLDLSVTSTLATINANYSSSAIPLRFMTGAAEAMRIDASRNLLVGTTNTAAGVGNTNTGLSLRGDGFAALSRTGSSGQPTLAINKNTNNGEMIGFFKDGSSVGVIGSEGDDSLYIQSGGSSGSGLHFHPTSALIRPARNGVTVDGVLNLGASNRRFMDLHLSGGVNFSANANASGMTSETLDDYEEGTWTVGIQSTSGTSGSNVVTGITTNQAYYTKVGQNVNIYFYATGINLALLTSGTYVIITGLPFQCDGYSDLNFTYRRPTTSPIVGGYVQTGTSYIYLCKNDGNEIQQGNNDSLTALIGSASYRTNS